MPLAKLVRYSRASTDFTVRVLRGFVWPKIDLLIRLALAEIFFVLGVLKLTNWNTALYLAAYEYPVSFCHRSPPPMWESPSKWRARYCWPWAS